MFLSINMWFSKLMRQFFFNIDKIVFNFISQLYDLMITIARTSVLSQADIIEMAERIYSLLAVFMIFKVTLSLITYVVNPDDFSDKTKGVSKLGTNIIISLSLLILTPYIFSYAYQLQTIILEDNSLATLVFGEKAGDGFLTTAGDDMAYAVMAPFFTPNVSIGKLSDCITLVTRENDKVVFNKECSGMEGAPDYKAIDSDKDSLREIAKDKSVRNYISGVENNSLGLMFREDIALETYDDGDDEVFIMDYKYIFSTVIGVVTCLLLISFCMDVGLRSIKLAFLQLVAPIPIISYVDPKSGKDGLFKKWYQMCFKTYISLFVRLLALYFAIYIISMVADMQLVDIIDGSYVTNGYVVIFIIIGALMFAKQLPKILEGLGIKLDGDGKFTLNPLKKFEEQAFGGKNITGMARGALVGTAGVLSGAGLGRGISGAWRGLTSGKGWKESGKAEIEMNRKMRQARLDGSSFGGRLGARFSNMMGLPSTSENIDNRIHRIDEEIKDLDNAMAPSKKLAEEKKLYTNAVDAMEKRAISKIENGEAGILSETYRKKQAHIESLKAQLDQKARLGEDTSSLEEAIAKAENESRNYLNDVAMKQYIDINRNGTEDQRIEVFGKKDGEDAALTTMTERMTKIVETYGANHDNMKDGTAAELHTNFGKTKGEISAIDDANEANERAKRDKNEEKQKLYDEQRRAKANESVTK